MFHVKHRPTYKELLVKADAFMELRNKIRRGLCLVPETSGGEVLSIDIDPDTNDLLVTWQHADGQRTHRITITEETVNVPRETSPHDAVIQFLVESDEFIKEHDLEFPADMSRDQWAEYADKIARCVERSAAVDVPRETSEPGNA